MVIKYVYAMNALQLEPPRGWRSVQDCKRAPLKAGLVSA